MNIIDYSAIKKHLEVAISDLEVIKETYGFEKPDRNKNYTEYNELVLCIGLLKSQLNKFVEWGRNNFKGVKH